jgi:predicted AAA+ superfamily ATPase
MLFEDLIHSRSPWWKDPACRVAGAHPGRRVAFDLLWKALSEPKDRRAHVLLGPRQVGKSVLLEQLADELLDTGWPPGNLTYFDFSDERLPNTVSLREVVDFEPPGLRKELPRVMLLDEITRSPRWDEALKQLVDRARRQPEHAHDRFLATDSAASLLRTGARESLQGRIDEHSVEGMLFSEFVSLQSVEGEALRDTAARLHDAPDRYLSLGGFPEHIFAGALDVVRRRIREDICDRAIGRDLSRRGIDTDRIQALFVSLVQDSGGIFEAASRARDIDGGLGSGGTDARTVQSWLRILEEASLIASLSPRRPAISGGRMRGSRQLRARPKIYAADHGMVPAFAPFLDPMSIADVRGKVLEAAVFRHLREARNTRGDFELSFFREVERHELDFVLDFKTRSMGIEVTTSRDPKKELGKVIAAARRAEIDELIVIHGGTDASESSQMSFVPYHQFLLDPAGLFDR